MAGVFAISVSGISSRAETVFTEQRVSFRRFIVRQRTVEITNKIEQGIRKSNSDIFLSVTMSSGQTLLNAPRTCDRDWGTKAGGKSLMTARSSL